MDTQVQTDYERIRSGEPGYHGQKRGMIAVWGKEAVQFLDGLISNDMKTLEDGGEMLAAFPNAQGRLLAVVRVLRQGDRFLFETEEATREKVFNNLFRFTFAGDFFVEDLSGQYQQFELIGELDYLSIAVIGLSADDLIFYEGRNAHRLFVPIKSVDAILNSLNGLKFVAIKDDLQEILRIEAGIAKYGVDMDETTIVPELGIDGLISYKKGCYIGQEIIARIHFRGHVAKRLTGLVAEPATAGLVAGAEIATIEGKNAGRVTSVSYSPKLEKMIALAFVRYDYLVEGTELRVGEATAIVRTLPFV